VMEGLFYTKLSLDVQNDNLFPPFSYGVATYYGIYACLTLGKMKVLVCVCPFCLACFLLKALFSCWRLRHPVAL